MAGDVHHAPLRLVIVSAEPVGGIVEGEKAAGVRHILPPRKVGPFVDRPVPELVLAVARHHVAGILGLRPLVRMRRGRGPELEGLPVVGGVDEDVVAAHVAPPREDGDADEPAHPVDRLRLPDPDRPAPVAFCTIRWSTGMNPEGRCPCGKFHSIPPEIQAPVMLIRPGLIVRCQ